MTKKLRVFLALALLPAVLLLMGADVSPTSNFYVNDYANVLSNETEQHIMACSVPLAQQTGAQVVVLTVQSLGGKTPQQYALEVGRSWGIGDAEKDNGLLILLSTGDRQVRVEVGKGLEGALNDARVGRAIDNYAMADYKEDRFDEGTRALYDGLLNAVCEEYGVESPVQGYSAADLTESAAEENADSGEADEPMRAGDWIFLVLFFFVLPVMVVFLIGKLIRFLTRGRCCDDCTWSDGCGCCCDCCSGGFCGGGDRFGGNDGDFGSSGGGFSGGGGSFGGGGAGRGF